MRRRDVLALGMAALSGTGMHREWRVLAQARFPERPIRLVVPYAPGGVFDAVGRPWADRMKALLGTVVIENIGGAGGSLGAAAVARAQPDGYTILLGGGGALVINPVAASRTPYDPIKDFEPIALLVVTGLALVVHPSLPVHSLGELIAYAKANPGKLSYGSAGVGSVNHLTGELFKSLTGTPDIVHVPYKGAGPAVTDLISGQIPMVMPNVTGQIIELPSHRQAADSRGHVAQAARGGARHSDRGRGRTARHDLAELHRAVRAGADAEADHRADCAGDARRHGRQGLPADAADLGLRGRARFEPRQDPALRRGRNRAAGRRSSSRSG